MDPQQLTALRKLLAERFSDDELRALCFDLGLDYENLRGGGKAARALDLVDTLNRHGQLADLVKMILQTRPDLHADIEPVVRAVFIGLGSITDGAQPITPLPKITNAVNGHPDENPPEPQPRKTAGVVKILFLAANPLDTDRLKLDQEVRAIDQALQQSTYRQSFDLETQWAVRVADLQALLLRYTPDIVHFSGHGSQSSQILLEDELGRSLAVPAQALGRLFEVLKDNIRCVVLNACFSRDQAREIARHIDAVVGMTTAIGDEAAIDFARAFYQALGYGRDLQTAYNLGCLQIDLKGLPDKDTPKLICPRANPKEIVFVQG
jgi:hypothetical protein